MIDITRFLTICPASFAPNLKNLLANVIINIPINIGKMKSKSTLKYPVIVNKTNTNAILEIESMANV